MTKLPQRTREPPLAQSADGGRPAISATLSSFSIPEASDLLTSRPAIETYLMDMDGVLVHQERLIPGADQFISRLQETGHRFLVLTNNSIYTPRDLAARLTATGLQVPEQAIWTSALATARFLDTQRPQASTDVIGQAG
jgi:NagD protein